MNATALRAGVLLAGLLLAWRIVQVNVVLYDENGVPRLPAASANGGSDCVTLRKALDDNPGHVVALLNLARSHEAAGNEEAARRA